MADDNGWLHRASAEPMPGVRPGKLYWLPEAADPQHPTEAELAAGIELSELFDCQVDMYPDAYDADEVAAKLRAALIGGTLPQPQGLRRDCGAKATCVYDYGTGSRYGCEQHDPYRPPLGYIAAWPPILYSTLWEPPTLATTGHLGIATPGQSVEWIW